MTTVTDPITWLTMRWCNGCGFRAKPRMRVCDRCKGIDFLTEKWAIPQRHPQVNHLMTTLELRIATILCQHGRITRDMPSKDEIQRALAPVREIMHLVLKGMP